MQIYFAKSLNRLLFPMRRGVFSLGLFVFSFPLYANINRAEIYDLSPLCVYTLTGHKTSLDVVQSPSMVWQKFKSPVVALGNHDGAVWLRCEIENSTETLDWVITSRYPFSSRIELFRRGEDGLWTSAVTGTMLTAHLRAIPTREDAMPLKLPRGRLIHLFIKYESPFTKIFFMQAMPLSRLWQIQQTENYVFFAYSAILFLIVLVNVGLAFRTQNVLPIYYTLALVLTYLYQTFEFGIAVPSLFPSEKSPHMLMFFGGLTAIAYVVFLSRLLGLKITQPKLHRVLQVFLIVLVPETIACSFGIGGILLLQVIGRTIYFLLTFTVFYCVFRVYAQGFRPAIYSGYGLLVLFAAQTTYLLNMSGITVFDGYAVKFLLPIGQMIEFVFFFRSVLLRVTDQDDLLKIYRIESVNDLRAAEKLPAKLRLTEEASTAAMAKIQNLLEVERIYRREDLSLASLAQYAGISRHSLSELLNTKLNKTFYELLNEYRIREAEELLAKDSQARVLDVALAVGFNSKSTFNKEFKRLTGRTPTEIRSSSIT